MAPKICVLGAGASGLTSIKACVEGGLDVVCFELTDNIGGLWRFREEDIHGLASVMKSTVINSSKEMGAYSDFPAPDDFPNYMHNSKMVRYFELYAKHFDLVEKIRFAHKVIEVKQSSDYTTTGQWTVKVVDLKTEIESLQVYDGVMVCTGHHTFPNFPNLKGQEDFKGKLIHSHSYKRPREFEDQKVLVVGIGNSGGDIAVELSSISDQVYLSTRRGTWVSKRVGPHGLPFDCYWLSRPFNLIVQCIPMSLSNAIFKSICGKEFDHEAYQIQPNHDPLSQHVMVNDALPNRILSGTVILKHDVSHFTKEGVVFLGEREEAKLDTVILATGYKFGFHFLEKGVYDSDDENDCKLYKYVFPTHLKHPSLCFIGLIQPIGSIIPISENQARWYVQVMSKNIGLPNASVMVADVKRKREEMSKRYYQGAKHTIQVDYIPYMDEIASIYGSKPNFFRLIFKDPRLFWACWWGSCTPYQYRLNGPNTWDRARETILSHDRRVLLPLSTRLGSRKNEQSKFRLLLSYIALIFGIGGVYTTKIILATQYSKMENIN